MEKEFVIPESLEEAIARQEEVSDLIDSYTIAEFEGKVKPFSEEKLDELVEEKAFLDSIIGSIKPKKEEKAETDEAKNGISYLMILIFLFLYVSVLWFMVKVIGVNIFEQFILTIYGNEELAIAFNNKTRLLIAGFILLSLHPALICVIAGILRRFFFTKNEINKKVSMYLMIGLILDSLINVLIVHSTFWSL